MPDNPMVVLTIPILSHCQFLGRRRHLVRHFCRVYDGLRLYHAPRWNGGLPAGRSVQDSRKQDI